MNNIKSIILRHNPRSDYLPEIEHYKGYPIDTVYRGIEYPLRDLIYGRITYRINCELDEKR